MVLCATSRYWHGHISVYKADARFKWIHSIVLHSVSQWHLRKTKGFVYRSVCLQITAVSVLLGWVTLSVSAKWENKSSITNCSETTSVSEPANLMLWWKSKFNQLISHSPLIRFVYNIADLHVEGPVLILQASICGSLWRKAQRVQPQR